MTAGQWGFQKRARHGSGPPTPLFLALGDNFGPAPSNWLAFGNGIQNVDRGLSHRHMLRIRAPTSTRTWLIDAFPVLIVALQSDQSKGGTDR